MSLSMPASRVAVIGDVAGHRDELHAELLRLGADPVTGALPAGLVVVQVGDLIHRGPDSAGVVALVDGYLRTQPDQWVQLAGNHEAQYLRTPAFDWPETIAAGAVATLRQWWAEGRMRAAASVAGPDESFLITHAGLTSGYWERVLDSPADPAAAAAALNSFIGTHEDVLLHAGQMLGGGRPDPLAGPFWASAGTELLPSWLRIRLPFSQIHGHARIGVLPRPRRGAQRRDQDDVARRTRIDAQARHEVTGLDGGRIIGVDPGHSSQPRRPWRAWTIAAPPGSALLVR